MEIPETKRFIPKGFDWLVLCLRNPHGISMCNQMVTSEIRE